MFKLFCEIKSLLKELSTRNVSPYEEGQIDAFNKVLDLIDENERRKWES